MYTLRMLGSIGLSASDGREVDALLRQPKHVALLAYLAMPRPGTWHRRDALLATFWPELDQARARTALRSALHTLRRHLAEGAIRNRGDDEVSLDPRLVTTDVGEMMEDISAGRHADALARYHGELLPALNIAEAEGYEKWLAQERRRLNAAARKAATLLAESREQAGDLTGAVEAARRATELDPDDEVAARLWIALLDKAGDRTQAFAVYERFRTHVAAEFGTRPSAETMALVESVRTRRAAAIPTPTDVPSDAPAVGVASGHASPTTRENLPERYEPARSVAGLWVRRPRPFVRARWWGLAAAALVAAAGSWAVTHRGRNVVPSAVRRLVVLPMENETGDRTLDYVGTGVAEGIARRLEGIGGLTIRSGARSEWPAATRHDYQTIGREFGSTILLKTTLAKVGDSLEVRAAVVDAETSGEKSIAARRFSTAQLRDVESELAAAVAGALFRVPLPALPRALDRAIDPESYRLMLDGWHRLLTIRDVKLAKELFQKSIEIDPSNARAWSGLSSAWATQTTFDDVPFDAGYDRVAAAAARALALDSLQGTAWANLAFMRALRYRSLAIGEELIRKAEAAEPANPEVFLVKAAMYRHAYQWNQARDAIRIARELDPLNPFYLEREVHLEMCADRPDVALRLLKTQLLLTPSDKLTQDALPLVLARLGRYDDAIAAWREQAAAAGDAAIANALGQASGATGYWSVKHLEGQRRLAILNAQAKRSESSPLRFMLARFAAGDVEGGYDALAQLVRRRHPSVLRLRCLPDMEEIRRSPRFAAALAQIGALPLR
ncbi:MAG: hypothetical protein M3068_12420 [Gemmatimonadota bacterium]|nr:hypothetical protein [Gemmatimonadota bacterium]